jgi:hypothetical protein
MDRLASLVTEEIADTYALYGPAGEVVEKAKRFEGLADELLLGGPWWHVGPDRLLANHLAILEAFGR